MMWPIRGYRHTYVKETNKRDNVFNKFKRRIGREKTQVLRYQKVKVRRRRRAGWRGRDHGVRSGGGLRGFGDR